MEFGFHAANIGGELGCDDVSVYMTFDLGFERAAGERRPDPRCSLGPATYADGFTWDFVGVSENLTVSATSTDCSVLDPLGTIEDGIRAEIGPGLRTGIRTALRDQLLVPPRAVLPDVGEVDLYETRECGICDLGCLAATGGVLPPGRRHSCVITEPGTFTGVCHVQLEPDRINLRPDGLEIVLSDGAGDLQDAWLHSDFAGGLVCRSNRDVPAVGNVPQVGELPNFTIFQLPPSNP